MYTSLQEFLVTSKILYDLQFGFRKHHSPNHALVNLVSKISEILDRGEYACSLFWICKRHLIPSTKIFSYKSSKYTVFVEFACLGFLHTLQDENNSLLLKMTLPRFALWIMVFPRVPSQVPCCFLFISTIFIGVCLLALHSILQTILLYLLYVDLLSL